MLQNGAYKERPLCQMVRDLSDAQLTMMGRTYQVNLGPITPQNRKIAERRLHVAMIEERAKFRAQQQFAQEQRNPSNFQTYLPARNPYGVLNTLPQNRPQAYWPPVGSSNVRGPPPPSSAFQYRSERPDPVREPSRYISWRQQFQKTNNNDNHFLGLKMPFSLETVMDIRSRISDTISRFRGGETEGSIKESDRYNGKDAYQKRYQEDNSTESCDEEEPEESLQQDLDDPFSEELEKDTLSELSEDEKIQKAPLESYVHPYPYDFRKMERMLNGTDAESQKEIRPFDSFTSVPSVYYEFTHQVPMARTTPSADRKRRFRWWWQRREEAGDERIPEGERTTEQDLLQERELKTINYLSEVPTRVDDGVLELMGRVDLRDDSDEEALEQLEEIRQRPRSFAQFCRHIFHLLWCDPHGKLDAEKLRCSFFCCCMAFGVYVGFKLMK
ncbi:uncharacterized protein LOC108097861 [Drosophila ficusphila]|uniref:uncharacterized protein LOC108097861 n=1 Tax=Drosophila ficusphila TaxID=30025 RepID=UPI001C891CBD|nr:uncharacterized protein LOC108097861 [Drosophila ficusphila]